MGHQYQPPQFATIRIKGEADLDTIEDQLATIQGRGPYAAQDVPAAPAAPDGPSNPEDPGPTGYYL